MNGNNDIHTYMVGGKSNFKIIIDKPKVKYLKYNGKNIIHTINTIDNDSFIILIYGHHQISIFLSIFY